MKSEHKVKKTHSIAMAKTTLCTFFPYSFLLYLEVNDTNDGRKKVLHIIYLKN